MRHIKEISIIVRKYLEIFNQALRLNSLLIDRIKLNFKKLSIDNFTQAIIRKEVKVDLMKSLEGTLSI